MLRESTYLLDVVVGQSTTILELFTGENETLLVWRDTLLILDLALDVVDCVGRLHLEGDSLAREGLDEADDMLVLLPFETRRRRAAEIEFEIVVVESRSSLTVRDRPTVCG